ATEKVRGSVSRRASGMMPGTPGLGTVSIDYQAVLTRPLILLLESLKEEGTELFAYIRAWLQDLPTLPRVFDILVARLQPLRSLHTASSEQAHANGKALQQDAGKDDSRVLHYYLQHIYHILKWSSSHTWMILAGELVEAPLFAGGNQHQSDEIILQAFIAQTALTALEVGSPEHPSCTSIAVQRTSLSILQQLLQSPLALPLKEFELEVVLINRLHRWLGVLNPSLQTALLETILLALQLRLQAVPPTPESPTHMRRLSQDLLKRAQRLSLTADRQSKDIDLVKGAAPPPQLVDCLRAGFASTSSQIVLDSWVKFLAEVLPLFAETIFQSLLPLVGTFCSQIRANFEQLKLTFEETDVTTELNPEPTLIGLMNGLEQILASAHDKLIQEEVKTANAKTPEQPQGFFGNIASNMFASEAHPSRSATANSRLTVLLCIQDTIRVCFDVWTWGALSSGTEQDPASSASFAYTSPRMRNCARRILESTFAVESLESLETLAVMWCQSSASDPQSNAVMSLLHALNGSRPKNTIPAIFNAVYSRTNPQALDPSRMSTLTSDLADTDLVAFLVAYTRSLEDDTMDEIWTDCMTFLRDVLANPLPHRQILPALLEFTTLLAEKVENTNFGEERRMRRELG
ncbi:hypothetical protein LTS18_010412, partial [Coniosporium uncinatum]